MKDKNLIEYLGSSVGIIFTSVQTNEIFQIISFVITMLATILTILLSLLKLYTTFKNNGKINEEEIDKTIKEIESKADNFKKGE